MSHSPRSISQESKRSSRSYAAALHEVLHIPLTHVSHAISVDPPACRSCCPLEPGQTRGVRARSMMCLLPWSFCVVLDITESARSWTLLSLAYNLNMVIKEPLIQGSIPRSCRFSPLPLGSPPAAILSSDDQLSKVERLDRNNVLNILVVRMIDIGKMDQKKKDVLLDIG